MKHSSWTIVFPLLALLAFGGLTASAKSALEDDVLDVVIFAGQSNMEGYRTNANQVSREYRAKNTSASLFDGENWVQVDTNRNDFGPENGFAIEHWESTQRPLGIIKVAKGGTSLASDWSPRKDDSLFEELIRTTEKARASRNIRILGVAWMQGESDAKSSASAKAYKKNLEAFVSKFRKTLKLPDLPFVAGRVNPPEERFPGVSRVRKAIESARLNNYAWVDCDDLPKLPDSKMPDLHYNSWGTTLLGFRFADEILHFYNEGIGGEKASNARGEPIPFLRANLQGIMRHRPGVIHSLPGMVELLDSLQKAKTRDECNEYLKSALEIMSDAPGDNPGQIAANHDIRAVLTALLKGKSDLSKLDIHLITPGKERKVTQRGIPGVRYRP